ncbi:Tetratricopeptide repeat-containing protein [Candidatus Electrothrix aarhusensis]|uniref:Tetratricopeptide repeat-containing protein n=1 Tax=Candidatus Electrothrix aarhusensis TaxID=1859131 RepID=A0A3S3QJN1_9BACT|nr:Tetratricopeptide repeat-containing protein [Candidatus Electrothrix aarhusensis]
MTFFGLQEKFDQLEKELGEINSEIEELQLDLSAVKDNDEKYQDVTGAIKAKEIKRDKVRSARQDFYKDEEFQNIIFFRHGKAGGFLNEKLFKYLHGILAKSSKYLFFKRILSVHSVQYVGSDLKVAMPKDLVKKLGKLLEFETETEAQVKKQLWDNFAIHNVQPERPASHNGAQTQPTIESSVFVGRKKELYHFKEDFLFNSGSFILNIHTDGDGGVGKTQLLLQMQEICHKKYAEKVITSDELIDLYHTEARSKTGFIKQVIEKLGSDQFPNVISQLREYRRTKDSSKRQYLLDDAVAALEQDYKRVADKAKREGRVVVLFFDTYEVIQRIDKEKEELHRTDFSRWLEEKLFPVLRADNTRIVIAGRYQLKRKPYIADLPLALFDPSEAVEFLTACLKDTAGINTKKNLLEELQLTDDQLDDILELSGYRPIYLALFMDWYHFNANKRNPEELLEDLNTLAAEEKKAHFEKAVIEWCWNDTGAREFIYPMAVAYRRMTSEIMEYLTDDSLENCQKILLGDLRPLSFIKHKKDKYNRNERDVILLHDEMRDLLKKHWNNWVDPDQCQQREIAKKIIRYYEDKFLSPDYSLTSPSFIRLQKENVPAKVFDKLTTLNSPFFTEKKFRSALNVRLDQDEIAKYADILIDAARLDVLQEKREVYTPELIEYAFMADADDGVQRFCDEFDIAMEDGQIGYAAQLLREAVSCCGKYNVSSPKMLDEVQLRAVQYHINGNEPDIRKALDIIRSVYKQRQADAAWQDSLRFGKFKLWEGIAWFWLDKFDDTIRLLKEAREVFIVRKGQGDLMFLAENWIGYTYYRKADFTEAEGWMKQSLKGLLGLLAREVKAGVRKKRNIQQHIQYTYGNLAMLYRYKGRFAESIRYTEAAHNIVEILPRNRKEILRSLNTMAHVLAVAGRSMDARFYLEQAREIYKEIPDDLLGGRMYVNFSWLSYDSIESAYMIEYYRASELQYTVGKTAPEEVKCIEEAAEYSLKAIHVLQSKSDKNVAHKELADAYFNLGELYMMMPEVRRADRWKEAEQAFIQAAKFAKISQFRYTHIDALESLVTLYYFWNRAAENLSDKTKAENEQKQEQYRKQLETDLYSKMKYYPNLMGRYELTLGDIEFDQALDLLKERQEDDTVSRSGVSLLRSSFKHYLASALYKEKFNRDRYFLVLRVFYNRLNTLIREMGDYYELAFQWLRKYEKEWKHEIPEFSTVFDYVVLLHTSPEKGEEIVSRIKKKIKQVDMNGDFRYVVLLNKCLLDAYRILAKRTGQEKFQEKLVGRFNRQSRVYRLLGDTHYTRFCYERARKAIVGDDVASPLQITDPILRRGLEGCTDIIEGEFYFRRGGYGSLLEIYLHDELPYAQRRFDKQFENSRRKAFDLLKRGKNILEETVEQLTERLDPDQEDKKYFFYKQKRYYHRQLAEAYFQLGELQMMNGLFHKNEQGEAGAFEYLKKSITVCSESENNFRHDDAIQSYLNALYFSEECDDWDAHDDVVKYKPYLEEKIKNKGYKYPWVAARFRITQGDVLFSRSFQMEERPVETDSENYRFVSGSTPVGRENLLPMFRCYVEACNYKAGFNDLSFEAGLRVLRRRIELIADSPALDILHEILPHIWQDGEHLRKRIEELEGILQLIRMRSLTGRLVKEYEK